MTNPANGAVVETDSNDWYWYSSDPNVLEVANEQGSNKMEVNVKGAGSAMIMAWYEPSDEAVIGWAITDTITVSKRPLEITATSPESIYVGGTVPELPDPTTGAGYTVGPDGGGLADGDSLSGLRLAYSSAPDNTKPGTYDTTERRLVYAEGAVSGGIMQYVVGDSAESAPTSGWGSPIPTATNAGTYYVWYKVKGDENHNDSKAQVVEDEWGDAGVYVGKADLPSEAPGPLSATCGDLLESVKLPEAENGKWSWTEDPGRMVERAGECYFEAMFTPNDTTNYNEVPGVYVLVNADKGASSVKVAPKATNPTYNGEAQALVKAGTATGGTMKYSLDGEDFTDEIPVGVVAGDYTVWYMVAGDENHNDSEPARVKATIGKAAPQNDLQAVGAASALVVNVASVNAEDVRAAAASGATTVVLGPKVKRVEAGAFAGTGVTTVIVKTKKLKKSTVKNAFKGSKVKIVKVKIKNLKSTKGLKGKALKKAKKYNKKAKAYNKKIAKKYKKFMTKKVVGKKVKVKA